MYIFISCYLQSGYESLYGMLRRNRILYSIGEIGDISIELKRRLLKIINENKQANSFEVFIIIYKLLQIPGLVPLAESTNEMTVPASGQGDGYVRLFEFTMNEWPRGVINDYNIIIRCDFQCKIAEGHDRFAWAVMRKRERIEKYKYEKSNGSEITKVSNTITVNSYNYNGDDDDEEEGYTVIGGETRQEIKRGTFAEGLRYPELLPNPYEYREFIVLSEKWRLGDTLEV